MEITAEQLSELLQGKVEGDPEIAINKVAKIEEGIEGSISFLANPKYAEYLYTTKASIVLIAADFVLEKSINKNTTLIRVKDPRIALATLMEAYAKMKDNKKGISSNALIEDSATLGENVFVGAGACIGNNQIKKEEFTLGSKALQEFAQLDDFDLLSSIKVWTNHDDPILSRLCTQLAKRTLFKIELQKQEFEPEHIENLRSKVADSYGITVEEASYFVFTGSITNSAYNPIPLYDCCTTFAAPVLRVLDGASPLDIIAIDHLPSLVPLESSRDFSRQLLRALLTLGRTDEGIWARALAEFEKHTRCI